MSSNILQLLLVDGLTAFRSFLRSEFSDENIEFWMACEDFKKTKNQVKMATKAKKIYEDFIQSEGPREVRDSCYVSYLIFNLICQMTVSNVSIMSPWKFWTNSITVWKQFDVCRDMVGHHNFSYSQ